MLAGLAMFTVAAAGLLLTEKSEDMEQGLGFARLSLWLVLVACPVFAVDTWVRLTRRTPSLVATEEGLVFRSILGFSPPIPWREIDLIAPVLIGKKLYLGIYLNNPNATLTGFGTGMRLIHVRNHAAGDANIAVRAFRLGVNPIEAAGVLERIRTERGAP